MTAVLAQPDAPSSSTPAVDIECSCRAALTALFYSAAIWLVIATGLSLFASVKLHAPALLSHHGSLSFGRVRPAALDSFLYGFAVPSALGVGLWILSRLGHTKLVAPLSVILGLAFWNLAVTVGILGILGGDSTGYTAFEMPRYAAPMLFAGYLLIAIPALLTFHARAAGPVYPSQYYFLGAVFWFPWIFSTAAMLLLCAPVRGVFQASLDWWYANNLEEVFLGFAGLGSILYFVPKLIGRPLHSGPLAAFALWMLAFFGGCGGIPAGSPLPVWMPGLSTVATSFTSVAALAIAVNIYLTSRRDFHAFDANPTLRFSYVAFIFWLIATAQQIVGALPRVTALTGLTWFGVAQRDLQFYGFFGFAIFGALYYILPRLLDAQWCPRLLAAHFWLSLIGVLALYLPLVVGGVIQGIMLSDPRNPFMDVLRGTMVAVRASTLGDLLIFTGAVVFLVNFTGLLCQSGNRLRTQVLERIS